MLNCLNFYLLFNKFIYCLYIGMGIFVLPLLACGVFFESILPNFNEKTYQVYVENLFQNYERSRGACIRPGTKKRVGLKVCTIGGEGLSTPVALVKAVIFALKKRGYLDEQIEIFDQSIMNLRKGGYLLPVSMKQGLFFEGCPIKTLEDSDVLNDAWYYESSLPSVYPDSRLESLDWGQLMMHEQKRKRSYLPVKLFLDVDFWINLPVGMHHDVIGVSGALTNMTFWNATNTERFTLSEFFGPIAMVEMAMIPELSESLLFTLISLEHYQVANGCIFNARYAISENRLWLSDNPWNIDKLLWKRIVFWRKNKNLTFDQELPRWFNFETTRKPDS